MSAASPSHGGGGRGGDLLSCSFCNLVYHNKVGCLPKKWVISNELLNSSSCEWALRSPLRSPALFCTSPTSYVPYVSHTCPFTCPVRVPYVSLTCPGVRVPYLTST